MDVVLSIAADLFNYKLSAPARVMLWFAYENNHYVQCRDTGDDLFWAHVTVNNNAVINHYCRQFNYMFVCKKFVEYCEQR